MDWINLPNERLKWMDLVFKPNQQDATLYNDIYY